MNVVSCQYRQDSTSFRAQQLTCDTPSDVPFMQAWLASMAAFLVLLACMVAYHPQMHSHSQHSTANYQLLATAMAAVVAVVAESGMQMLQRHQQQQESQDNLTLQILL